MSDQNTYSTTDFYTTAILLYHNFDVIDITKEGPGDRVKRFHFEDTDELQEAKKDWLNGKTVGNIRKFKDCVERVKDLVHGD